jgi:glycosyltransferase involved in cell wall biosynthesis
VGDLIDIAIAHSSFFSDAVFSSNPILFENRCYFIPYGVKQLESFPIKHNKNLKLVFLGRLERDKGVLYLKNIDDRLKNKGINVDWTIIGKGSVKSDLITQWRDTNNICFEEPSTTEDVYKLLKQQDIFIFPTTFEGTPVSILECLANGIVTITNDLPGGIRDVIKDTSIGYRCLFNDLDQYEQYILELESDRNKLYSMQVNCYNRAQECYNIVRNSDAYFELFSQCLSLSRSIKKTPLPKMSRLDKPYLPNFLVKFIRKL